MGEGLKRAFAAVKKNNDAIKEAKRLAREREAITTRQIFYAQLAAHDIPIPCYEYPFHSERGWRFDYAWIDKKVALEVDGGIWIKGGGRHTRGSGWLKDSEKLNTAASLGWRLLRTTPSGLHDLETIALIKRTLSPSAEHETP